MTLLNSILANSQPLDSLRASPFGLADDENNSVPQMALVQTSIFTLDEPGHVLTPEEVQHLTFCERHGMNAHAQEVTALMEAFVMDDDVEHLRRAIAILKHQISLSGN